MKRKGLGSLFYKKAAFYFTSSGENLKALPITLFYSYEAPCFLDTTMVVRNLLVTFKSIHGKFDWFWTKSYAYGDCSFFPVYSLNNFENRFYFL